MHSEHTIIPDHIISCLEKAHTISSADKHAAIALTHEAYSAAEHSGNYRVMAEVLLRICNLYSVWGNYGEIEMLLNDAIELCIENNDIEGELYYNEKLAIFHLGQGNSEKVLRIAQKQIERIETSGLYTKSARAYSTFASAYRMSGDLSLAKESAEKALSFCLQYPNETDELEARQTLGSICGQLGLYDEALEQFTTIYLHPSAKSTLRIFINVCGTLSELYTTLGDFSKALEFAIEGLRSIKTNDLRFLEATLHSHAGLAYLRMGNVSAALSEYLECKTIRTEIGDKAGIAIINTRLGRLYLDSTEYDEALRYGYEALAFSKEHGFGINEAYAYLILGEVYLALKEYEEALQYLNLSYQRFSELRSLVGLPSVQRNKLYTSLATVHKHKGENTLSHSYRNELQMLEAEQFISNEQVLVKIREFEKIRTEEKLKTMGIRSVVIPQIDKSKTVNQHHTTENPTPISIQILGRFRVVINSVEIQPEQWKRKRNRDIFKYLIVHYGQTIPVEKIIDVFWEYDAPANAANIVWNAASIIRTILEPELPKGAASSYLKAADRAYTLDFGDKGIVDASLFIFYIKESEKAENENEKLEYLEKSLELYEGDLLPEDMYEEWTDEKREELKTAFMQACMECSKLYADKGNFSASARYAKKVISADNTYRKAYELFVNVCKEGGNTIEAHSIINKCKTLYRKEYDSSPPPWLEKLEQSLIQAA